MPVRTELSGPVAWFVIDDPPTRSAISRATAESGGKSLLGERYVRSQ